MPHRRPLALVGEDFLSDIGTKRRRGRLPHRAVDEHLLRHAEGIELLLMRRAESPRQRLRSLRVHALADARHEEQVAVGVSHPSLEHGVHVGTHYLDQPLLVLALQLGLPVEALLVRVCHRAVDPDVLGEEALLVRAEHDILAPKGEGFGEPDRQAVGEDEEIREEAHIRPPPGLASTVLLPRQDELDDHGEVVVAQRDQLRGWAVDGKDLDRRDRSCPWCHDPMQDRMVEHPGEHAAGHQGFGVRLPARDLVEEVVDTDRGQGGDLHRPQQRLDRAVHARLHVHLAELTRLLPRPRHQEPRRWAMSQSLTSVGK